MKEGNNELDEIEQAVNELHKITRTIISSIKKDELYKDKIGVEIDKEVLYDKLFDACYSYQEILMKKKNYRTNEDPKNKEDTIMNKKQSNKEKRLSELLYEKEKEYKTLKHELNTLRASAQLGTDWKKVNNKNMEKGLPKITNESMRKAYIDLLFKDKKKELIESECRYHSFLQYLKENEEEEQ